jgi:hypothetical protein
VGPRAGLDDMEKRTPEGYLISPIALEAVWKMYERVRRRSVLLLFYYSQWGETESTWYVGH